jgi:hypothetical protein
MLYPWLYRFVKDLLSSKKTHAVFFFYLFLVKFMASNTVVVNPAPEWEPSGQDARFSKMAYKDVHVFLFCSTGGSAERSHYTISSPLIVVPRCGLTPQPGKK